MCLVTPSYVSYRIGAGNIDIVRLYLNRGQLPPPKNFPASTVRCHAILLYSGKVW